MVEPILIATTDVAAASVDLPDDPDPGHHVRISVPDTGMGIDLLPTIVPPTDRRPDGARLLVIDDEPDVRAVTVDTLRVLGFDVVAAESARLGLDILDRGVPIDLVVTDFSMPEMNGIELIRHLRLSRPALPCLLVTGHADLEATSSGDLVILCKPYRMQQLSDIVGRMLAQVERGRGIAPV